MLCEGLSFALTCMAMAKWYSSVKQLWPVLKKAAADWSHDRAPRLGAALAYYTIFSMVPLLIVIIAIIGLVFGEEAPSRPLWIRSAA